MNETRIPQISDKMKARIKNIVEHHYGFTPKDEDIDWIEEMLRSHYVVLHDQRIIRELVVNNIGNTLLEHRDRIGSIEFERIQFEKGIFKYLTFASMCFRAGIPVGTISICRTAIESGLRERLAEKLAREEVTNVSKLPEATWKKLNELTNIDLPQLINQADTENVIKKQKIEEVFQEFKYGTQDSRKILDKIIHGDIVWMVNFVKDSKEDTRVVGAKNQLHEYKIIADMRNDEIAIGVLKATYKIAEILCYKNHLQKEIL